MVDPNWSLGTSLRFTAGGGFCSAFSEVLRHADDFLDYTTVWVSGRELDGELQCYTGISIDNFWISKDKKASRSPGIELTPENLTESQEAAITGELLQLSKEAWEASDVEFPEALETERGA